MKPDNHGRCPMQQVADWLEKLGLGQYAERFAENDISFSVVPDLTDQDLKDIGVSLGHRRQLLREIANLDKTQENDAERAVRAALAIQRALAELNRKNEGAGKPALAARIAIDTGPAVLDASGEIFGDVPNIAARAQAVAEPGAVVVTARVQQHVAGLFIAEERGNYELKGVPEPVTLYRIVRASGGGRRAGQRHLTPLVGRDEEIVTKWLRV
jgi:class 3 adenylate cyclase